MSGQRPYKVSWFSSDLGERVGAAYGSRERRDARARDASLFADVKVWEVDEQGYVDGKIRAYVRPLTDPLEPL